MNTRPKANGTTIEETDRLIITEWRFPAGAETGWHRHAMPYVVVYLTDAEHLVETADGLKTVVLQAGTAYSRPAGIEHNVINAGTREIVLVETELK